MGQSFYDCPCHVERKRDNSETMDFLYLNCVKLIL